jgi:hypothetical protein
MRAARVAFLLLTVAAGTALAACAAKTGGDQAGAAATGFVVPIEVENNMDGLSGASIYISRSTGSSRRLLGPVETGRKRTFQYDAREGMYRLTARPQGIRGDSVVSDVFQLQPGMVVQWTIPTNRLLTGTR